MLNVGRAIRWDSALGVGRHKVSDYVKRRGVPRPGRICEFMRYSL